tara:strand:+ start:1093 stop:1419 length:327 start_codon:yes stop_codon:yes gene_type:complete
MLDYILNLLGLDPNRPSEVVNFRFVILLLFFIGIIFIVIELTKSNNTCPQTKIEYRYLPRTFKEEQESPVPIDDIFGSMFQQSSPWVGSFTKTPENIRTLRDQNYVSQ